MTPEKYAKMKEFEKIIKQYLMVMFEQYLPEEKIELIEKADFIDKSVYEGVKDSPTLQGNIIRSVVNGVINLRCTKEVKINGEDVNVEYGGALQKAAVEYYSQRLAANFGIKINQKPELAQDIQMMEIINERLENGLDKEIFNKNAIELLDMVKMQELVERNDNAAIDEYLMKQSKLADEQEKPKALEETVEQSMDKPGSVQMINEGNKAYVKYTDEYGNVQLVEANNPEKANQFYKQKLASIAPGETIDSKQFFGELTEISKEIPLTETEHVEKGYLNSEEVDMLSFITATSTLKDEKKEGMLHSGDQGIHIMKDTKDVVFSESTSAGVSADLHEDDSKKESPKKDEPKTEKPEEKKQDSPTAEKPLDISERMLTQAEYEELVMKYTSGTELTLEELRLLRNYEVQVRAPLMQIEEQENQMALEESGPKLKLPTYYGFANKNILGYLIFVLALVSIAIGYLLFVITH